MDGLGNVNPIKGYGTEQFRLVGSFQCNGTNNPAAATHRTPPGMPFAVTYAATGVFTVTLSDPSAVFPELPLEITVTPQFATLATDWFECGVLGEFNRTTRSFQIQAHRSGTGQAPANTAGNRINFCITVRNSTSR